jgi:hypothetical protein
LDFGQSWSKKSINRTLRDFQILGMRNRSTRDLEVLK